MSKSCIRTYTGGRFFPLDPTVTDVYVLDIAHALSNMCRFTGHVTEFYSVAQHSVHVSEEVRRMGGTPHEQLQALLHDASEAYMTDVSSPVKHTDGMAAYREAEKRLTAVIYSAYCLPIEESPKVKEADLKLLVTEARDLMGDPQDWPDYDRIERLPFKIVPLSPKAAKRAFIDKFQSLTREIGR